MADNSKLVCSANNRKEDAENCAKLILCRRENGPVGLFETGRFVPAGWSSVASDGILEDALALLNRRRQDLYSQFYSIEDKLTTYEDYIERIRDGGDADLARQCAMSVSGEAEVCLMKKMAREILRHFSSDLGYILLETQSKNLRWLNKQKENNLNQQTKLHLS